jgi:predicted dehydrogenase
MYRVAIVGCGKIAGLLDNKVSDVVTNNHAFAFQKNKKFELVGCVDTDESIVRKFAKKYAIPNSATSIGAILESVKPHVVSITTPDSAHYDNVRQILESNSSLPELILIEKPVCSNVEELESLIELSTRAGIPIVVNHSRRFHPVYRAIRQLYLESRFGHILSIDATYYGGWCHNGIHLVDTIRFLFDQEIHDSVILESIPSADLIDPTITIRASLGSKNVPIWFRGWSDQYYQVFDLEFRFTGGRIRMVNFEQQISWEKCSINSRGESVLVPENLEFDDLSGDPLTNAVQMIESYMDTRNQNLLEGNTLPDLSPSMKTLWAMRD